jgi:hypothetical protein
MLAWVNTVSDTADTHGAKIMPLGSAFELQIEQRCQWRRNSEVAFSTCAGLETGTVGSGYAYLRLGAIQLKKF